MAFKGTRFTGMIALRLMLGAQTASAEIELQDGTKISESPTFIVTYVEVAADQSEAALGLLKAQAETGKSHDGNVRFEVLQRIGQDNHFVLLETWSDRATRDAHAVSEATVAYRNALEPMLYAPYDERPPVGLVAADMAALPAGTGDTIYVVTHADIIPPEQFAPCERQIDPNGPCGIELVVNVAKASQSHDGNIRFDVLTQNNRTNHMSVVEMWESLEAQQAHQMHPDKKRFRNELAAITPEGGVNADALFVPNMLTGSLWDERLYKLVAN